MVQIQMMCFIFCRLLYTYSMSPDPQMHLRLGTFPSFAGVQRIQTMPLPHSARCSLDHMHKYGLLRLKLLLTVVMFWGLYESCISLALQNTPKSCT